MGMRPLVYLAGGIAGLSGWDAIEWREEATKALFDRQIETLSPMRAKHNLLTKRTISPNYRDYDFFGPFFTSRGIMARDFNDVKRADALLVNLLGLTQPSLGTIMELAWAYAMQKPAVVAIEKSGNPHDNHPMIHEATAFRVETLDEAIDAVAVVLGR